LPGSHRFRQIVSSMPEKERMIDELDIFFQSLRENESDAAEIMPVEIMP